MDLSKYFNLEVPLHARGIASAIAILVILSVIWSRSHKQNLDHIPTAGPTGLFSSFFGPFRYLWDANNMVQEGYYKYKGSPFKIAKFSRWVVVVSGPQAIEDYRQVPDDDLTMLNLSTEEGIAIKYTLGSNIITDQYHIHVVRNQLTKNLGVVFPDIRDEIVQAFDDVICPTTDWSKVSAFKAVTQIVCRTSNRIFVGLPLCRDPDWIALNLKFPTDVMKAAAIINLFPTFLKPIAGRLLTKVDAQVQCGMRYLAPIIKDRQQYIDEYGKEREDKPNDLISWLMDEASEVERSLRNLFVRVMTINFGAINTTSMSFTHALYHLAAMPHYIQLMREEVEAAVAEEGWTKNAIGRMYKIDSFFKETQRFNGLGSLSMHRTALTDFTLADGTFIPKDTSVCAALFATHRDEQNYTSPDIFDGFRFANMELSALSEEESAKQQMVATTANHLSFGYGRHACPGRFFAATELKAMMAHLVLTYDFKLENEGVRPPDTWLGAYCVPNRKAKVLFRKRQT
jgi:cytochrome P450